MTPKEFSPTSFDALILLCGGPSKVGSRWRGNFETRIKVAATAEIFRRQQELAEPPDVISSGGSMWGAPAMGEIMAKSLASSHYGVPIEKIIREDDSTNSGEQVRRIKSIVGERGYKRLGVVADSVHGAPVVKLFQNHGLEVELLPAEDYLLQRNPRYKRVIDKLHSSLYWGWWKFKYSQLSKEIEKDPLLTSNKARIVAGITRLMRTKISWLRLPGTTR